MTMVIWDFRWPLRLIEKILTLLEAELIKHFDLLKVSGEEKLIAISNCLRRNIYHYKALYCDDRNFS